jgi:hypothetical protein
MPHCKISHATSNKLHAANNDVNAMRQASRQPRRRRRSMRGAGASVAGLMEDKG